jgi:hypothetical protein
MHIRMKPGTRVEETARTADEIEQMLHRIIPASQLDGIIDNLGIPYSGINLSYNTTGTTSAADGDILVSLKEHHNPTNQFIRESAGGCLKNSQMLSSGSLRQISWPRF